VKSLELRTCSTRGRLYENGQKGGDVFYWQGSESIPRRRWRGGTLKRGSHQSAASQLVCTIPKGERKVGEDNSYKETRGGGLHPIEAIAGTRVGGNGKGYKGRDGLRPFCWGMGGHFRSLGISRS